MKKTVLSVAVFCLVCLCAAPASAKSKALEASVPSPYRNDILVLSSVLPTANLPIYLYNSITRDPLQFHNVLLISQGIGTVNLTITLPTSSEQPYNSPIYYIFGFNFTIGSPIGFINQPLTTNGTFSLDVEQVAFSVIWFDILMLYAKGEVNFPVVINVAATGALF
jgi:hypothetical protein